MKRVDVRGKRRLLDDFFKVDEVTASVERFDGTMSEPRRLLVFERGDSVAALVWLEDAEKLLFTEQFRLPTLEKGPGWLLEIAAGMVDRGEAPDAAIRREIEEELGYRVEGVQAIAHFYVSPGGSSERIWLYSVDAREPTRVSSGGGIGDEDVRVVRMTADEAREALAAGRFVDAKTIVALQWWLAQRATAR
jgi:nudix-type nucleoside diphosphatase (YffH/AdpP family)